MQKRICHFLLLVMIFPVFSCTSEPASFEEEVRQAYRDTRGFFYIKIPPAVFSLLMKANDDPQVADFFGSARQVGIISFGEPATRSADPGNIAGNLEGMLRRWEYEDLMSLSEGGRTVSMKIREKNGKVTDLVAIISESSGQVAALTLSGDIDVQRIVRTAADFDFGTILNMPVMGRHRQE